MLNMNSDQLKRTNRNLHALLVLGVVVALVGSAAGGLFLALGYSRPEITQPMWKFGQQLLIAGLMNLAIYLGIFFQIRRLSRAAGE